MVPSGMSKLVPIFVLMALGFGATAVGLYLDGQRVLALVFLLVALSDPAMAYGLRRRDQAR